MSGSDISKIVGAIAMAAVIMAVLSVVGDALVQPGKPARSVVHVPDAKPPASAPKAEPEVPLAQLLASADPKAGAKAFNKCKACHDPAKDGKNKVGPGLWNVLGADKAAHAGYSYSSALQGLAGNWTYEDLDAFLKNPRGFAKGTKMTFAGVKKAEERADIIVYMRSLSDSPMPLP